MAKYGIKGVIGGGAAPGGAQDKVVMAYRQALADHGKETEPGEDLCFGFSCHIAETEKQAIDEARGYFEENMKMFGPLGFVRGLTGHQISALGDLRRIRAAGLPTPDASCPPGALV